MRYLSNKMMIVLLLSRKGWGIRKIQQRTGLKTGQIQDRLSRAERNIELLVEDIVELQSRKLLLPEQVEKLRKSLGSM